MRFEEKPWYGNIPQLLGRVFMAAEDRHALTLLLPPFP